MRHRLAKADFLILPHSNADGQACRPSRPSHSVKYLKKARKTTKVAGVKSVARGVKKASGNPLSPKPKNFPLIPPTRAFWNNLFF